MATNKKSYHSVCRWTFHSGKGGFQPDNIRPSWHSSKFGSADFVRIVQQKIRPKIPNHITLGVELHYDTEINEKNVKDVASAISETGLSLAMITPGAHSHYGYGGVASLDNEERSLASQLALKTVDIAYGDLKNSWLKECPPTLVLWNGSYGYDLATVAIKDMYQALKEEVAGLVNYEKKQGGELYFGIEPKPNEGHPCMLLPTVASAILFWKKLKEEFNISLDKKGLNKEFGHSEMIGLDHLYDTVEELDNNMVTHVHMNSQGYNDGLIYGGPGKYDIDHGVRINGMNISLARLLQDGGYNRWKGHDMQARPYDNEEQAVDRVVRSILSWEACEEAARKLDTKTLLKQLSQRETAKAEDMLRDSTAYACKVFNELYS